ncbi:MAG: hypothetical protein KGV59_05355 [Tenacibaculum sp.]|nr:hypothetical protein [Tenacibaculum sp.]
MEEDNWLNEKIIKCTKCGNELKVCDHSPFEHSYRLYCNSCPKRVDIGTYEKVFEEIENYDELSYEQIMIELEKRLQNCECGGEFMMNSKRRCLHCAKPLNIDEEQNVWLKEMWSEFNDDKQEQKIEKEMLKFIVQPKWK